MFPVFTRLRSCSCCTAILPADEPVCPRCQTTGYVRRKNSLQWTLALLFTSIMLYLPANIMPIMITDLLGSKLPSTIIEGVVLIWSEGSYPVAAVIFIASILVPTLKMIAIAGCAGMLKGTANATVNVCISFMKLWNLLVVGQ